MAIALVTLGLAGPSAAQDAPVGPRIRITTAQGRFVGRVVTVQGETVVFDRAGRSDPVEIQRPEILKLEFSERRGRRGRGAAIGALVGLGAAVAIGVAAGQTCTAAPDPANWGNIIETLDANLCFDHFETGLMGGILTVPLGALVGALMAPGEKWHRVGVGELSVGATASRGNGVGLQVALRF